MVSETAIGANSPGDGSKGGIGIGTCQNMENLLSPRFKSVAAMAGWDEEALIIASLVVEDTPERNCSSKHKRRSDLLFKSPTSSSSRRKRRPKRSPVPIPAVNLDMEVIGNEENKKESVETKEEIQKEKKIGGDELHSEKNTCVSGSNSVLPCIEKLREELSCAICLEICFEPSTTTCGHSFCQKCLRSAADRCGRKCPKCRQLISNGRSCTVNTVLWNTIQLLFPQEVEARRTAAAAAGDFSCNATTNPRISEREETHTRGRNSRNPVAMNSNRPERHDDLSRLIVREGSERRRRVVRPSQDRDAAFALRLQRQEFMEAFGDASTTTTAALSLARANLRAMASRAVQIQQRRRGQ